MGTKIFGRLIYVHIGATLEPEVYEQNPLFETILVPDEAMIRATDHLGISPHPSQSRPSFPPS